VNTSTGPRCPPVRPKWGSPALRSFLFVIRASFCHDMMTTLIFPALVYPHKAMLLAQDFFPSAFPSPTPKKILENIYVIRVSQTFLWKKFGGWVFVCASKSTFEVLTPVWFMGGAQKISQWDHINSFLISKISQSFEKFYAERRKIRIFFKSIP